jgi:carbamoyl-phosphate synthase large subunit
MAIGRTFGQAFLKAMRSRELDAPPRLDALDADALLTLLERPASDRYDVLLEAFGKGATIEQAHARTSIDPWFLRELEALARDPEATFAGERSFKSVDTCAAEFAAETPYYYSAWERKAAHEVNRPHPPDRPSVVILGAGPNRIGQGIEFDYCCVHAAMTVRESGRDAVMINCNPETVSTDYDTSDRLYFEPLTLEDVLAVVEVEQPEGVIVQFGGQTPLKLAHGLQQAGVPILGTSVDSIDLAEERGRFGALLERLGYSAPPYATADTIDEALERGDEVGYPLLVRPSYVLGGRAMEIVYSRDGLADYLARHAPAPNHGRNGQSLVGRAIFLDRFLENAIEVDVDALCDGEQVWVGGIMQHVEEAGIHSGDSACVLPPHSLGPEMLDQIRGATRGIALGLGVVGLMNVQFAVHAGDLYVIEANPRASRTVPFVSKAIGVPLAKMACRLMLGEKLADLGLPAEDAPIEHVSVKEAVLPFDRFEGFDGVLGPEMRSTGEVMGVARDFPTAFAKAQAAAGVALPARGTVFITVTDADKPGAVAIAQQLHDLGFRVVATRGTAEAIQRMGIPVTTINKIGEGSPHVVDWMENGDVDLVVNTPTGSGARTDGWEIRRAAVARGIPALTTLSAGLSAARAIVAARQGDAGVLSLQELHRARSATAAAAAAGTGS